MSFLSHIGATAYKYEIELVLVNLRLGALFTSPLWIEWKRGSSRAKSATVAGDKGVYDFGKRAMRITSTMFKKKDKFQKKESRLSIKQSVKGKEIVVGYIDLDLAEYVNATEDVSESLTLNLQRCSDKMARLTFRLSTHWLKGAEITSEDEMSRSTNASTAGDGTESNESSVNEQYAHDVNDLDADNSDDGPAAAASSRKGAKFADSDEEAEDAKRKVKFSKQSLGRTSRESSLEPTAPPRKSNLKGASPSPSPPAASKPPSRAAPAPVAESATDDEADGMEEETIPFFGVSLPTIMRAQAESFPDLEVPVILDVLLRGLEKTGGLTTEGIFRVSPLGKARDDLRAAFERGEYSLPKDASVAAALLKHWLAELQEAVFPDALRAQIIEVGKIAPPVTEPQHESDSDSDEEYQRRRRKAAKKAAAAAADELADAAEDLRPILAQLPVLNLRVLVKLVSFLQKVVSPANLARNKMNLHALAVVFAPNLHRLPVPDANKRGAAEQVALDMKRLVSFVEHIFMQPQLVETAAKEAVDSKPAPAPVVAAPAPVPSPSTKKKPPPPVDTDDEEEAEERNGGGAGPLRSFAEASESEEDEPPAKPLGKTAALAAASAKAKKEEEAATAAMLAMVEAEEAEAAAKKKKIVQKRPSHSDEDDEDEPAPVKKATKPAAAAAPAPAGRRGRAPPPDDSDDDSDEEAAKRDLLKKKGPGASTTAVAASLSSMSIKDQLFAKKSTSPVAATLPVASPKGGKKPAPKDDSDDSDEDSRAPAAASQSIKDQLFARKTPVAAPVQPKKSSAKAAFGETDSDEEDDHGFGQAPPPPAAASKPVARAPTDSESEEEYPQSRRGGRNMPPPPQPSPSPRSALAAITAASLTSSKSKSPTNGSSSPSAAAAASAAASAVATAAAAEIATLRAQVASLEADRTESETHIADLEEELEQATEKSADKVAHLEKEVKRLRSENEQLQKSLEATSSSSGGGSSSKAVDALKKQVASLIGEKDDALADYEELEVKYAELRKSSQEQKKAAKVAQNELEDLREQLAEAQAGVESTPRTKQLTRNGSSGASSEEATLLQLRFDEVRTELQERLDTERKLTRTLQAQLAPARAECDAMRARELRFKDLDVIKSHTDLKKNAKDKLQLDLIAAYEESQKRIKFLTQQLRECDATLLHAKTGWAMTIQVLQDQVASHEAEIEQLKQAAEESRANVPFDQQQYEHTLKKLRKSEHARTKLSELLSSLEGECTRKKLELATALQSILDLQADNARIKEDLVRSGLALKTIADDNFELKEFLRMNTKGKK